MCYLWHVLSLNTNLLPSHAGLLSSLLPALPQPAMLPLKEFNCCRAYTFPFMPLQVKLSVCGQSQKSRCSSAIPAWVCLQAGWQPLHDGNSWGATGLRGPVLRGWVVLLLEYVFRQETHVLPWSLGEMLRSGQGYR